VAKTDERVMELVKSELDKNPDVSSTDLFEKAKKAISSVGALTLRQFHARYPLQIKRRRALADGGSARPSKRTGSAKRKRTKRDTSSTARGGSRARSAEAAPPNAGRDKVRQIFMRFAADLSAADARKDLVKVVAGVDRYVDDAIKAMGR
jgi:hypothetical protein